MERSNQLIQLWKNGFDVYQKLIQIFGTPILFSSTVYWINSLSLTIYLQLQWQNIFLVKMKILYNLNDHANRLF